MLAVLGALGGLSVSEGLAGVNDAVMYGLGIGLIIGGIVAVACLTTSPVRVSHVRHDTWFDHPDAELVVRGARRATELSRSAR